MTRYGKEAVVIVSEEHWRARVRPAPTLGALLAQHAQSIPATARSGQEGENDATDRPWTDRALGRDLG